MGITQWRLGRIGSYKCWFAVTPLSLKTPYSPGWEAAAALSDDGEWFPWASRGGQLGRCSLPPRSEGPLVLFSLLVCVYFDCHLKCRAPGSHPLFSWGWHSLLPFGLFDSLNFHLLPLSLFLLFLVSQLTALGTKRTRSLTACGFLATPQRNMSVCFFKNKLNILMFYFSISGEPLGQIRRCWQTVIKGGSFCSFPRVTVAGPLVFLHMLIWEFINQRHATHIRCLFKELKW